MSPHEQQLMLASGELISVGQVARYTPYSAEYLSLLARKGKLKAVKISRDWLTTRAAVENYIRLQEKRNSEKTKKILRSLKQLNSGKNISTWDNNNSQKSTAERRQP